MFLYRAFNLNFQSDIKLPELLPGIGLAADVTIKFAKVEFPRPISTNLGFDICVSHRNVYLYWKSIGSYLVMNGNEIYIDPCSAAEERSIRLPLLGIVIGILLFQRGLTILHGSAIDIEGAAVVFLGHKGAGKSSISSELYSRGYDFVSDDLIVCEINSNGTTTVIPSYPHIRLWPDSVSGSLINKVEEIGPLHPQTEKRGYLIKKGFKKNKLSLRQILIINRGDQILITPLQSRDAVIELIRYSYVSRFGSELVEGKESEYFLYCVEMVKNIPVARLVVPSSLLQMPYIISYIEDYFTQSI